MAFKMEQLVSIGIWVIIIGFAILFFGFLKSAQEGTSKTKVAVGGFIGPIPFGFGNDKALLWFVVLLSAAMVIVWLIFGSRIWNFR